MVCIDLPGRKLDVELSAAELRARRAAWTAPEPRYTRGWLSRYAAMVTNAGRGAVLESPTVRKRAEATNGSTVPPGVIEAITHSARERYRPKAGVAS
jgi:dihydroxy-acid dehydratase